MPIIPEAIDTYAKNHSEAPSALFEALVRETHEKMSLPQMQVGAVEGGFLRLLVRLIGARRALEIGMFTGYSGMMIADGLTEDGELITCDIDPKAEEIARRYFAQHPAGRKIQIRMGPALQTIASLTGEFDFVFIDADKENYLNYYEAILPKVRRGGLLVADNTLWSGRVLDPQGDSDRAIAAFNDRVVRDERVEKVQLTVRDGMTLMRKR